MKKSFDNTSLWNEAAVSGLLFGAVSIGCLAGKEAAALTGNVFLTQAAAIILWAVEFFGCILLMKNRMVLLRDKYEGIKITDSYRFGRRAALLSGLLLASAQALIIMKMPQGTMDTMLAQVGEAMSMTSADMQQAGAMLDKLPLYTCIVQWLYCFLYGTVLSAIMSRYIFIQKLFDGPSSNDNEPDNQ